MKLKAVPQGEDRSGGQFKGDLYNISKSRKVRVGGGGGGGRTMRFVRGE
jgi:hypothetical protein